MDSVKKLITYIKNKDHRTKLLVLAFISLGFVSFLLAPNEKSDPAVLVNTKPDTSVDTYIPRGFVLVPIELSNANSLGSLLGEMGGVVDLYLPKGKHSKKIASKLKIIKAPYNPELYAVLVREQESHHILSHNGPFIAVVQNPQEKGQKLVETTEKRISIQYQN